MPLHRISQKTRILLSILFPVLFVAWNLGFDLGAFGSILYRDMTTAWIFAVSTFMALLYVRFHDKIKIPSYSFVILIIPILWPLVDYVDEHIPNIWVHYFILFDYIIIMLGLLYTAYLFLRIIKADIFDPLTWKNRVFIAVMGIVFSGIGFSAGHYNYLFLECQHFQLSGDYIPHNCRKLPVSDLRTLYKHIW